MVGDRQIFVGMNELALDVPDMMHCWTYDWLKKKWTQEFPQIHPVLLDWVRLEQEALQAWEVKVLL